MIWLAIIAGGAFVSVSALFVLGLCKVAGESDEWMDRMIADKLAERERQDRDAA